MHRSRRNRAFVALWGIWITTALSAPAGVAGCAMHGGRAEPATNGAVSSSESAGADAGHAHHAMASAAATTADAEAPNSAQPPAHQPTQHSCCTCLGQCCAAAPVLVPMASAALAARVARFTDVAPSTPAEHAFAARPYALPFANGPPSAVHG